MTSDRKRDARLGKDSRDETFAKYWPELRGRVPEQWSRLTHEWLDDVDGRQQRLAEKLREAYGISEQEANRQVDDFVETHWGAISAGNMSAGSTGTSNGAGSRGNSITNTPATAATGPRGGGATSGTRSTTSTGARGAHAAGEKSGAPRQDHHRF